MKNVIGMSEPNVMFKGPGSMIFTVGLKDTQGKKKLEEKFK